MCIRAAHRDEWGEAERLLNEARRVANEIVSTVQPYPDLYYSGYTQDALKELIEASVVLAIAQDKPVPSPSQLKVEDAAYLNGLAEAASELRRRVMDKLRAGHNAECERLLAAMDAIYDVLVTMDFPDAITGGLRRNTDLVRGVLERTRSDLTISFKNAVLNEQISQLTALLQTTSLHTDDTGRSP
jgi:translin